MASGGPNSTGSPPKPWEKALEDLHSSSGEMGAPQPPGGSGGAPPPVGSAPPASPATSGATIRKPAAPVIPNPPTMPPVAAHSTLPSHATLPSHSTIPSVTNPYNSLNSLTNPYNSLNSLTQRGTFGRSGYGVNYGSGYGGYRQPFSSYGGGYSSSYGGYGTNRSYNSYLGNGQPQIGQGEFANRAQRGVEPAFRSIENIVRACASVSHLMESTLGSVHMSFTALIDVVEHFAHVRLTLTDNRFWRFIAILWRKFVNFLLRRRSMEAAWDQTAPLVMGSTAGRSRSWPLLIFISIVFGGPFFMWTMFRGSSPEPTPDSSGSAAGIAPPQYQAPNPQQQLRPFQRQREVIQDYNATEAGYMSVRAGQVVFVQHTTPDQVWYYVKVLGTGEEGYIPGKLTRPYQARS